MNYLFRKILPGYKFSDKYFDFPAGDMFWARTKDIYQMFKIDLRHDIPEEKGSKHILYDFERFWLFNVKLMDIIIKNIIIIINNIFIIKLYLINKIQL